MFNWFKKKIEPNADWMEAPASKKEDRLQKILLTIGTLEGTLKGIKNHWTVGNTREGDDLLDALVGACLVNLFDASFAWPEDIVEGQLSGIIALWKFLEKEGRHAELNRLIKLIKGNPKCFRLDQVGRLTYLVDVYSESLQSSVNANVESRLIFYVCQQCGRLNLVASSPCISCGHSITSVRKMRRALLLSSAVIQTPKLMEISRKLLNTPLDKPKATIDEVWGRGDLDSTAEQKTSQYNGYIDQLIAKSQQENRDFSGVPNLRINCSQCGKSNSILFEKDHGCHTCGAVLHIPYARRFKAGLSETLTSIIYHYAHKDDISYCNFIASYVLILDYALRRNVMPTIHQGEDLIRRFSNITPIGYLSAQYGIGMENGFAIALGLNEKSNDFLEDEIRRHVLSLNLLFSMLTSSKLHV